MSQADDSLPRLHPDMLSRIDSSVQCPSYDRSAVLAGVVHLGIGAFHRAHQAAVFDDCLESGDLRWGIVAASLRSRGVADQLEPQEGLYTLCVNDTAGSRDRVIGAVQKVIVAPEDPAALLDALASFDTHIVTLTITEKGYCLDPATGKLLTGRTEVIHDMTSPSAPVTAPGYLARALDRRRKKGAPALTIISCDNIPDNGARLRDAVCAMARSWDDELADWIAAEVAFPQTMVDRIVPATTPEDIAALAQRSGLRDQGMVMTEPFTQWVIEDQFAGERPNFPKTGVQLTSSVTEWENAKLRLLNGAHSTLAYLGALAGIDYIHEVVARPAARDLVAQLWDEAERTLTVPDGLDVAAYRAELMERFANTSLLHRTRQIAMDGSQKLPQRLLETIQELYDAGDAPDALAMGVAAWMRWVTAGSNDCGEAILVDDPMAERFAAIASSHTLPEARVDALLAIDDVFPAALRDNAHFRGQLTDLLGALSSGHASSLMAP